MSSIIDTTEPLTAVDSIIQDAEAKIDECLVNQFIDQISRSNDDTLLWPILNRVKSYMEHESFVMLNQARAFKIIHAAIVSSHLDTAKLKPHFQSMWDTVDIIVINNFTSAMTTLLTIFNHLWQFQKEWLVTATIGSPITMKSIQIRNITDIAIYCLNNMNNYHARHLAENLLVNIIIDSEKNDPNSRACPYSDLIRKELEKDSIWILNVVYRLSLNVDMDHFFTRSNIRPTLIARARKGYKSPRSDMTNITKCLANTIPLAEYLDLLTEAKCQNGALTYFAYLLDRHPEYKATSLYHLLNPLLNSNKYKYTENLKLRVRDLLNNDTILPTEDDSNDKQIQLCLCYLRDKAKSLIDSLPIAQLAGSILISFIRNNSKRRFYNKKLLECCSLLKSLYVSYATTLVYQELVDLNFRPLDEIIVAITDIDTSKQESKPLALGLISLLKTMLNHEKCDERSLENLMLLVGHQTEPDIVNECVLLLIENPTISRTDNLVTLVWELYADHKSSDDNELQGNLCVLLQSIDASSDEPTKDARVVQIVIDSLKTYITVTPTLEKIVNSLDHKYLDSIGPRSREALLQCIANVVGSEVSNKTRSKALKLLGQESAIQDESPEIFKDVNGIMSIARDINSYEKISHSISDCY